jgi:hypothetical protein
MIFMLDGVDDDLVVPELLRLGVSDPAVLEGAEKVSSQLNCRMGGAYAEEVVLRILERLEWETNDY